MMACLREIEMSSSSGYTSSEFYHFVGRGTLGDNEKTYEILLKVLDDRCISHPPHEKGWGVTQYTSDLSKKLLDEELIIPTITCYCDIPFERLEIHVSKYGPFALSFKREYVIRYGARPVLYIPLRQDDRLSPYGRVLLEEIEQKYKGFMEHVISKIDQSKFTSHGVGKQTSEADEAAVWLSCVMERDILAFIKPFDSHLPDNDPANYYMEREWRKYGNLQFEPSNVQKVLVPDDYVDRFRADRPKYAEKAVPTSIIPSVTGDDG